MDGHAIVRAALTGHVRRVVVDTDGVVINFGRTRRLFAGGARTALKLMAQSCENVGCDVGQLSCQIDHIQEWIRDGGATDTDNGAVKCGGHNRSKHRLGITERRDKFGKLIQFRRDGTPITPVGQRLQLDIPTRPTRPTRLLRRLRPGRSNRSRTRLDDPPHRLRRLICNDQHVKTLVLETSDGHRLTADLAWPSGDVRGGVAICHPHPLHGGNRFNPVVDAVFKALPDAGFAAIRFDFRSDYDNGRGERLDVIAALDALSDELGDAVPLFAVGYSFGAMVTLTTVDERIGGRVVIAPPIVEPLAAPGSPVLALVASPRPVRATERVTEATAEWPERRDRGDRVGRPLPRRTHRIRRRAGDRVAQLSAG